MPAATAKVVTDGADPGQGDALAKPRPEPRAIRISVVAMATTAPAKMEAQETADRPTSRAATGAYWINVAMSGPLSARGAAGSG